MGYKKNTISTNSNLHISLLYTHILPVPCYCGWVVTITRKSQTLYLHTTFHLFLPNQATILVIPSISCIFRFSLCIFNKQANMWSFLPCYKQQLQKQLRASFDPNFPTSLHPTSYIPFIPLLCKNFLCMFSVFSVSIFSCSYSNQAFPATNTAVIMISMNCMMLNAKVTCQI